MKKIIIILALILFPAFNSAYAIDAQWLEKYNYNKDNVLIAMEGFKKQFGSYLLVSPDQVRMAIETVNPVSSDIQELADGYINVLEGKSAFVWGFDFINSSDDIKILEKFMSAQPPYTIQMYDEISFNLKKINDELSLYAAHFPRNIKSIKSNLQSFEKDEIEDVLKASIFFHYIKFVISRVDERIKYLSDAERKLNEMTYEFSAEALKQAEEAIFKRIGYLEKLAVSELKEENYVRQVELDCLLENLDIIRSRHKLLNDEMSIDEIWRLKAFVDSLLQRLELEFEYARTLVQNVLKDDRDFSKQSLSMLTNFTSEFLPRTIFMLSQVEIELDKKFGGAAFIVESAQMAKDAFFSLLGSEIWSGDGYRITLRKLIFVLIFLICGIFICKWLSYMLQGIFFSRLSKSGEALGRKIIFYALFLVCVLTAFHLAEIPLMSFAFIGGALAIGIGFGTQNLFNNIISGLILATARPFNVGDQIEYEGESYVVVEIGDRSIHLWTFDDKDVFVQNRMFLENTVTNLTYKTNHRTRLSVDVRVEYGSDYAEVKRCLLEIATENKSVLDLPEPFVVIKDLADSGVYFSLYCWIDIKHSGQLKVNSDLRETILDEFAKKGIGIPYPKLDLKILK